MSDVNVNTSWTITPGGDYEYNGVLGCAGYDTENNRLFVSAQSPPNVAGNVTTPYCKGFHLTADYNGNLKSIPTDNESADLKRVRFTMSFAGSSYDLTDTRCYCQFANYFNVNIASWTFKHIATDATETTIASGTTLAQHDKIQIDFKNDYGAGQFIFEFEYATGTPEPSSAWTRLAPYIYGTWYIWGNPYVNKYAGNVKIVMDDVYVTGIGTVGSPTTAFCIVSRQNSPFYMKYWNGGVNDNANSLGPFSAIENIDGNNYVYGNQSLQLGLTASFASVGDAIADFYGAAQGGLNTTDFNDYDGYVWSCCLFANVANVSPGPMATESEGGTDGDFDTSSDALDVPDLPAEGVTIAPRAGDLYLCSETVLGNLQQRLFDSSISGAIRDIFSNVTDCILSVMSFPLPTSAYTARFTSNIFAGGQDLGNSTETTVIKRYIEYDCGTVNLHLFWDSALDLNPYTKLNIFIPGVGMRPLDADICMSHDIGLKYHIDLLTGVCVAFITVDGDIYQQHTGNIGQQMAFSGTRNGQIMTGILSGLAGNAANVANMSNPISGPSNLVATTLSAFKVPRTVIGNFGGSTAQLAVQQPYIEIERPIQQLPRDYTKYNAYPCYMTAQLVNLSGWTEIQDIFIDDIDCTQAEREKLLNLLHNGIIL